MGRFRRMPIPYRMKKAIPRILCVFRAMSGSISIALVTCCCLTLTSLVVFNHVISTNKDHVIPVIIVEEHHEALAYWFSAARDGIIPKQGNILIHIDGHSDEGTPEYIDGMPEFEFPKDVKEASYFIQRNDVFIQGAVMSGLVNHVIWIWPSWDQDMMTSKSPFERRLIQLGFTQWPDDKKRFCQCETLTFPLLRSSSSPPLSSPTYASSSSPMPSSPSSSSSSSSSSALNEVCSYVNASASSENDSDVTEMPRSACQIVRSYISEHINEHHIRDRLRDLIVDYRGRTPRSGDSREGGSGGTGGEEEEGRRGGRKRGRGKRKDGRDDEDGDMVRQVGNEGEENTGLPPAWDVPPARDAQYFSTRQREPSVILDIDEDFFGCENIADHLIADSILRWETIEEVDSRLASFLCPSDAAEEQTAGNIARRLVETLMMSCGPARGSGESPDPVTTGSEQGINSRRRRMRSPDCSLRFADALISVERQLMREFDLHRSVFCKGHSLRLARITWLRLAATLYRLPTSAVHRLLAVGFCFAESPKTFVDNYSQEGDCNDTAGRACQERDRALEARGSQSTSGKECKTGSCDSDTRRTAGKRVGCDDIDGRLDNVKTLRHEFDVTTPRQRFQVCHGANEPNSSFVFIHSPNIENVRQRMRTLQKILAVNRETKHDDSLEGSDGDRDSRLMKASPRVVTVCRSVRDGYTPRALAEVIEDGVLEAVIKSTGGRRKFKLQYDPDLFRRGPYSPPSTATLFS